MNNLVLVGFKGSGKTALACQISKHLKRTFIDTDDLIAPDCRAFYEEVGETSFRLVEKKIIHALSGIKNAVIATGGGVVLDYDNIVTLRRMGHVIYIAHPKEEVKRRLLRQPYPLFLDPQDPLSSFEKMYQEREKLYQKAAHIVIHSEKELWEVIDSGLFSPSPHGESRTVKPSVL